MLAPAHAHPTVVHTVVRGPLAAHLDRYRAAGFPVGERTATFPDGLTCGFVTLWPEYVELLAVEDEARFDEVGDPFFHQALAERRPLSLELTSTDTAAVRTRLVAEGLELPPLDETRKAGTPDDAPPDFVGLYLPQLPGSAVSCHTPADRSLLGRPVQHGASGVFAMSEWTLVVDDVARARAAWLQVTGPTAVALRFLTPEQWRAETGDVLPGGLAEVTLLSTAPDNTVTAMLAAGWERRSSTSGVALRHEADGVRYKVEPGDVEAWRARRS